MALYQIVFTENTTIKVKSETDLFDELTTAKPLVKLKKADTGAEILVNLNNIAYIRPAQH